ncbi:hypothetical protein [Enterovirga sp.]|uniref:hypothetical protein n=1 Tax=Enterovirga sp. TaxID=2026350 RepID=UPI002CCA007A|nr:hypothetical protein [Enterovirga sp.]HMO27705.1 hypothetical protein [Enterovirga sp.]
MKVEDYRKAYAEELDRVSRAPLPADADADSGQTLDSAIATIADASKPSKARLAALRTVQASTFLGPAFDPYRAAYLEALRTALANGDEALRMQALSLLASEKDDVARKVLLEGLNDPAKAIVPPAKAIQLLAQDDHGVAVPIARKLLDESADARVKEEALRALAADPKAGDIFAGVLSDKTQPPDLRAVGAAGLRMIDPRRFAHEVQRIIADDTDNESVRVRCLGTLAHLQGQGLSRMNPALATQLTKLSGPDVSEPLRAAAQSVLDRVSR